MYHASLKNYHALKKILSIQTHVFTIYVQINRDAFPNSLGDPKVGSKMKQLKKKQIEEHYLAHNIYKV
jgi:hypothetical protein